MLRNTWLTSWKSRWMTNRRRGHRGCRTNLLKQLANRLSAQPVELLEDRALLATITVTSLADNVTTDGQVTLREAIQAANTDTAVDGSTNGNGTDTIVFAGGLTGTITLNGSELLIESALNINGPGPGSLTIDGNAESRIFRVAFGPENIVSISGLTLTNGTSSSGGAILNSDTLIVSNCVITECFGEFEGGAIYSAHALTLLSSTLTGNTSNLGGAIYNANSALTISNSTISGNSASLDGGGIYSSGTATVLQSTISGNTAGGSGGGFVNSGFGTAYLRDTTFSGNMALDGDAGGIGNDGSLMIVFNSTVSGNSASANAGGIGNSTGKTMSVIQSTISGNTAGLAGGGIGNQGTAYIHQSTITGNSAAVADNGGGVGFTGATTLINTIVAGNTANGSPDDLGGNQNVQAASRHNLIGDPNSAGGISNGSSNNIVGADNGSGGRMLLATSTVLNTTLANNGGPTKTHALVTNSPAIDKGGAGSIHDDIFDQDGDSDVIEDLPFDQRGSGFVRSFAVKVDIGAFEVSVEPNIVSVAVSPISVLENGATNLVYTFTRTDTTGSLTVNFDVDGDAIFNTDYTQTGAATFTATSGTVTFAAGQSTKTVTIDPTGDTTRENTERVGLTVASGIDYIASDVPADGFIENDDFIVVDTTADVVNGNLGAGNLSLREAIALANEDPGFDKITFSSSVFGSAKTITLSNLGDLDITTNMEIMGPGATLLTISGNNASRIFNINDDDEFSTLSVTISGVKLINGRAIPQEGSEEQLDGVGGAILNAESLSISNSTISGNSAALAGGGIASVPYSHLSVSQSTISGNTAKIFDSDYGFHGAGGGIAFGENSNGSVALSTISGNTSVYGGGLAIASGSLVSVSQSTISGNTAQYGGGIYSSGGSEEDLYSTPVSILACTISGNTATAIKSGDYSYGGNGGGIVNEGFMTVAQSTIKDNTAAADGGGIGNGPSGSLTVVNSTLSNNNSTGSGGGIGNVGALVVIQSTISGNRATGPGSGIGNAGLASIQQSTIVKNTTTNAQGGGGLAFSYSTTLINTIVAGNTFNSTPRDIISEGEVLDPLSRHNLIGDPNTAGGLTNGANNNIVGNNGSVLALASILNATLANNGGPTLTHTLVSGSKAIDAGGNISVPEDVADIDGDSNTDEEIPFDQRGSGFVRRFGAGTPTPVDIGAVEFAPPPMIVTVAVAPGSVLENGTTNLVYTFTRTVTTGALTVNFEVDGTATFDNDYLATGAATFGATSGTVTFAAGSATKTITVDPTPDTTIEENETVEIIVTSGTGYTVGTNHHATGTITNDDATLSIAATNAEHVEGNTGTTAFTFEVTRAGATSGAASVKFAVTGSGGSLADKSDFGTAFPTGTVSFAANETSKVITINVKGDTTIEADEGFTVTLNSPTGAILGQANANGTILADDTGLVIAATNAVQAEGNDGDTPFTFTVSRVGPTTGEASVNFAVTGTGAAGANAADFGGTLPSGLVEFDDGETSQLITLNVSGDTIVEPNEAFTVTLSNPVGALLGTNTATGTINNDDTNLSIAATAATKPEGNAGVTAFTFTVTRTGFTTGPAHAELVIAGSGANPTDEDDISGVLPTSVDFAAGETSKIITVNVVGDTAVEGDETFTVTLANLTGATVGTASATGTIQSEDSRLEIVAENASRAEGNTGNTAFAFRVNRIGGTLLASGASFTITGTGDNPAVAADFAALTGTVNLAKGVTSAPLIVNVKGDLVTEADEGFTVTLSNPKNTTLGAANTADGTILNDENTLSIAADSADKAEGDTGASGTPFTFTITRTGALASDVSVKFTVAGLAGAAGSGITAAAAADFVATTGTVNIPAGQATGTLTVNVLGDTLVESAEGFKVTLSAPTGAVLGTAANIVANGVIRNDDASVSIAATSAVKAEETGDTPTPFTFTVTRTGDTTSASSVNFAVAGAATGGADAIDFGGTLPTGIVEFAENETTKVVTIDVTADDFGEANEGFVVTLLNPVNCIIGTASANGTINNDDTSPSFAIRPLKATNAEGSSTSNPLANTAFTFTVERTGNAVAGSVQFAVTGSGDNPANAEDFANGVLPSGTLNFTASQKTQTVTINVRADKLVESNEGFTVSLANPTGVTNLASPTATGSINNDDTSFSIAAVDAENEEGNSGLTAFTFLVTRAGLTTGNGSVKFVVSGVNANPANAADFGTHIPANTVNFAANETQKTITINVKGDTTVEPDEDFVVTLNTPGGGATIANPTANGTIIDDDLLAGLP